MAVFYLGLVLLCPNARAAEPGVAVAWGTSAPSPDPTVRNTTGEVLSASAQLTMQASAPLIAMPPLGPVRREGELALLLTQVHGTEPIHFRWQFNGQDLSEGTNHNLVLHRLQTAQSGAYRLVASNVIGATTSAPVTVIVRPAESSLPVAWGNNAFGQSSVPAGLTSVVQVSAGPYHTIALKSDGTLAVFGSLDAYPNGYPSAPAGLTDIAAVAAGYYYAVFLRSNGTASAWLPAVQDRPESFYSATGLLDVVAVSAASEHAVLLKRNGEVLRWSMQSEYSPPQPTGLSNVVAIANNLGVNIALRRDGTVVEWSDGAFEPGEMVSVPGATNIVAVAAGLANGVGLRYDGEAVAWGSGWGQTAVPLGLNNIVALAAAVALMENGRVVGFSPGGVPDALTHVRAISSGWHHVVALTPAPYISSQPGSRTVFIGIPASFSVSASSATPLRYQWRHDGMNIAGATNATMTINSVQLEEEGNYSVTISNDGYSVTSASAVLAISPFNLPDVTFQSAVWGDYDNDGFQDLLTDGENGGAPGPTPQLFRNNGDGSFTLDPVTLFHRSARGAWADFDNDGWIEPVIASVVGVMVWRNRRDGTFTNFNSSLSADYEPWITTQDFDRDGQTDLALGARLYRNLGGGLFAPVPLNLQRAEYTATAWGDFDNDGWSDFLLSGRINGSAELHLMRNLGGGGFTNINAGLPNIYAGGVGFGDFDNDGWLDIALSGIVPELSQPRTFIYRNQRNGTFSNMSVNLPHVRWGSLAIADYDNDGLLDLFLSGETATNGSSGIFRNDGDWMFTRVPVEILAPTRGAWGNYDNDGRLDLVYGFGVSPEETSPGIFRSKVPVTNTPPISPSGLRVVSGANQLFFDWEAGSDAQTPVPALTYNVRVGSSNGLVNVLSPASRADGSRQIPAPGNSGARTALVLTNVSFGRYFWSVQTVDGAFAGSPFSSEQMVNYAAITLAADGFTASGVTLNGRMDTNRSPSGAGFEWGTTTGYGNFLTATSVNSVVSAVLSGVIQGATYHYRLVVTNADGVAFGADESFRAADTPEIVQVSSEVLGSSSALLHLSAVPNGLPSVASFDYGLTTNYGLRTVMTNLPASFSTVSMSQMATGLIGGTVHHFRAVVSNPFGTVMSADQTFSTTPAPEASTAAASDVSSVSAVLNGTFRANTLTTRVWFEYGQTTNYGLTSLATEVGSGTIVVPAGISVSNLGRTTLWHYRAVASNAFAITYGSDVTFTTLSDVITDSAINIGTTVATLRGGINPEGLPTTCWFEYGLTTNYGATTPVITPPIENDHVQVFAYLFGLARRTAYHYRLVAAKPAETNFGGNQSFVTSNDVFTLPATEITLLSARLNGSFNPDGQPGLAWFEFGPTGGPTNATPPVSFAAGISYIPATHSLTGLAAYINYSCRLWVSNAAGLRSGDSIPFTTPWLFSLVSPSLPAHTNGALVPADFDNDGWLDLLSVGGSATRVHRNVGGTFASETILLPGASPAAADVADFDNDGWTDFAVAGRSGGTNVARVYRNLGGTNFIAMTNSLVGISNGIVRWADYDSDGRSDILLAGQSATGAVTRLYRNIGEGQFADVNAALPVVRNAAAAWCDFNRDGHPDLTVMGRAPSGTTAFCYVLRGDGRGGFMQLSPLITGVGPGGSIDWGDADNDGYPDLLIAGLGTSPSAFIRLYHNNSGTSFDNATGTLPQFTPEAARWGDYDSDGWLDILVQGQRNTPGAVPAKSFSAILRNRRDGTFEENRFPLPEVWSSSGGWADFNRDGKLDVVLCGNSRTGIVSLIYLNNLPSSNTPPLLVSGLAAAVSNHTARLSWQPAMDGQTPSPGLSYAVWIRKLPEGIVVSSGSGDDGVRRIVQPGGKGQTLSSEIIGLTPGRYSWSVQAVDTAYAGGPFADEIEFEVVTPIFTQASLLPDGRRFLRFLGLPSLSYQLETSTNLTLWIPGPILGPLTDEVFETIQPASSSPQQYFRLGLP